MWVWQGPGVHGLPDFLWLLDSFPRACHGADGSGPYQSHYEGSGCPQTQHRGSDLSLAPHTLGLGWSLMAP